MADIFNMLDTWNAGATVFTGIKLSVTDTASAAGSLLMDLQVGGVSQFKVSKAGNVSLGNAQNLTIGTDFSLDHYVQLYASSRIYPGGNSIIAVAGGSNRYAALGLTGLTVSSNDGIGWHSTNAWGLTAATPDRDLILARDAANTLAQRNGVNAQAFNLYQSYTDASNYTRGRVAAASGIVTLAGESAGTGAADIDIALTPKGTGRVRYGTHAAIAAETVTGYIEIKDAGGTVRKIAVVS